MSFVSARETKFIVTSKKFFFVSSIASVYSHGLENHFDQTKYTVGIEE